MLSLAFLTFVLLAFDVCRSTLAATGSVCSSGIYKDLLFLSTRALAESYCSAHFPSLTVTTIVTATVTVTANAKRKRSQSRSQMTPTTSKKTSTWTTTPVKTTTSACNICSVWSSLSSSQTSLLSTLCSCIETPPTTTITSTVSKTTTSTRTFDDSSCQTVTATAGPYSYAQYSSRSGYTEDPNNPGNDPDYSPITTTYLASYDACTAINACANHANTNAYFYNSFDLHFLTKEQIWECVQYYNANTDGSYFDVTNSDVAHASGFCMVGSFHPP